MSTIVLSGQILASSLHFTPNDQKPVLDLRLAFKVPAKQDAVYRIKVTVWGDLAKEYAEAFSEDDYVVVQGLLRSEMVQRPDGVKQQVATITASSIQPGLLGLCLNSVSLAGRTGKDTDVKYFESGSVKSSSSLAVSRRKDEKPDWFNLEAWGKTAETMGNHVLKGSSIGVEGSLKIDSWKDKTDGSDRFRPVVQVQKLTLLGKPANKQESNGHEPAYVAAVASGSSYDEGWDAPF